MASLNLGLLADSTIQLENLQAIAAKTDFRIEAALLTRKENLEVMPNVDVWLVRVDIEDECAQAFIDKLDSSNVLVIYDEEGLRTSPEEIEESAKRFSKKIESCGLEAHEKYVGLKRAKNVWVLAASAGGPEAVIEFIKAIPESMRDVAFVYVQHMHENMAGALVRTLQRNTPWDVHYCSTGSVICEKSIYLASPSTVIEFSAQGVLTPTNSPWLGHYKPSVDQVVAKIWRHYGKDSGVIVFSGMGDDGAKTCHLIKHAGGQVWVQSPESCAVDSMPCEVMNTECVSFTGSPVELANKLATSRK